MKYSITMAGIIVMVAGTFLAQFFTEGCATEIADKLPLVIGAVVAWVGRMRAGGVDMFGAKK